MEEKTLFQGCFPRRSVSERWCKVIATWLWSKVSKELCCPRYSICCGDDIDTSHDIFVSDVSFLWLLYPPCNLTSQGTKSSIDLKIWSMVKLSLGKAFRYCWLFFLLPSLFPHSYRLSLHWTYFGHNNSLSALSQCYLVFTQYYAAVTCYSCLLLQVVVISTLSPFVYQSKLEDSIPLGYMNVVYVVPPPPWVTSLLCMLVVEGAGGREARGWTVNNVTVCAVWTNARCQLPNRHFPITILDSMLYFNSMLLHFKTYGSFCWLLQSVKLFQWFNNTSDSCVDIMKTNYHTQGYIMYIINNSNKLCKVT